MQHFSAFVSAPLAVASPTTIKLSLLQYSFHSTPDHLYAVVTVVFARLAQGVCFLLEIYKRLMDRQRKEPL